MSALFWCLNTVSGELKRLLTEKQRDLVCSSPLWIWGVEPYAPKPEAR